MQGHILGSTRKCNSLEGKVLEIVAISPMLLAAWQRHTLGFHTPCILTSLEHYLVGPVACYSTEGHICTEVCT